MKIYGYEDNYIEKENGMYIVYNSYSNKVIALNKKGYSLLKQLVSEGKKNNGTINRSDEETKKFIYFLNKWGILFNTSSSYNNMNYSFEYERLKVFHLHKAYLHLTQRCNLNCRYCYNKRNIGKYEDLSTEKWKLIIQRLKDRGFDYIVFTGGEVTLREDYVELAQFVNSLNMDLHILTNGTHRIPKEAFKYATSIEISLDNINEVYNANLRVGADTYKVLDFLKGYSDSEKERIIIKTVVSKENQHEISVLKETLKSIGITNFMFMPCQPIRKGEDTYPSKTVKRELHKFDESRITKCNGCYEVIAINSDGNIFPCQALIKDEFCIANIFEDNWYENIKGHDITNTFIEDSIVSNKCKTCKYKYLCGGPCKAAAYNYCGDILEGCTNYCTFAKKECDEYLRTIDFLGENKYETESV